MSSSEGAGADASDTKENHQTSPVIDITGDDDVIRPVSDATHVASDTLQQAAHSNSISNNYTAAGSSGSNNTRPTMRCAATPMEGSVINDWMEGAAASVPIESSSLTRQSSSSSTTSSRASKSNKNSPSKSPGCVSSNAESSSSLELFTISSSDASLDSSSASVSMAQENEAVSKHAHDNNLVDNAVTSRSPEQGNSNRISSNCDSITIKEAELVQQSSGSGEQEVTSSDTAHN